MGPTNSTSRNFWPLLIFIFPFFLAVRFFFFFFSSSSFFHFSLFWVFFFFFFFFYFGLFWVSLLFFFFFSLGLMILGKKKKKSLQWVTGMKPTNSVKNIEWWCQMGVVFRVMSDEWRKLSDGNWVMKKNKPNKA